jgi:hypothetical protein
MIMQVYQTLVNVLFFAVSSVLAAGDCHDEGLG